MPFIHLNYFIKHRVLDHSKYCNIADYVQKTINEEPLGEGILSPLELADLSEQDALKTLEILSKIKANAGPIDYEIADVKAWSCLGLYFAEKLRGGTALQLFRETGNKEKQAEAIAHLQKALEYWKELAVITDEVMQPVLSAKLLHLSDPVKLSWTRLIEYVEYDIEIAEKNIIF